jgi:hypothetical protein
MGLPSMQIPAMSSKNTPGRDGFSKIGCGPLSRFVADFPSQIGKWAKAPYGKFTVHRIGDPTAWI